MLRHGFEQLWRGGFVERLLRLIGLDWAVPDLSILSRRLNTLKVNISYRGSQGPMHLPIESPGIKVEGEGAWTEEGQQTIRGTVFPTTMRKQWRFGQSRSPPATEATRLLLPGLLTRVPTGQEIAGVTADGACDPRKCHDAVADRGAHAVIPPCRNAGPWKTTTAGAVSRNEALRASKCFGRTLWRRRVAAAAKAASKPGCTV